MASGIASRNDTPTAGLLLKLRVWFSQPSLDAELAREKDPKLSKELTLRAEQLCCRNTRQRLARAIEGLVGVADHYGSVGSVPKGPPFRPRQVLANRSTLLGLADRLRGNTSTTVAGLARCAQLFENGCKSLIEIDDERLLGHVLEGIVTTLDDAPDQSAFARSNAVEAA